MQRPWWLLIVLGGVLAAASAGGSDGDDLERNRRILARWRADPDHYQRLQRDLKTFHALPPDRQDRLRRFDRRLHEGEVTTQTRLWSVLVRYASWLEKLPDTDRARVLKAPDGPSKLKVIREIRDREWVERLPEKLRAEVQALPHDLRGPRIAELREEERRQRHLWQKGTRSKDEPNLRPNKLSEFTPEARAFIKDLTRQLTEEEKARLDQAEGKWPDLPRVVRELTEAHPTLPPLPSGPITKWAELPAEVKRSISGHPKRRLAKQLQGYSSPWPEYAIDVHKVLEREKLPLPALGASRPKEFPEEIRRFLESRLFPSLTPGQKENLARQEGRWPDYPRHLVRLARDRHLLIPGMTLPPGPVEVWENARLALPDVPDRLLYQFARDEASPEDRARWELDKADPMGSRKKVKDAWYRQRLAEQERKRAKDTVLHGAQ